MAAPIPIQQVPKLNQMQQGLQNDVIQNSLGILQKPQSFDFAPIAQQARTQFNTQTIPGLAERFASLGSGSLRNSSVRGALAQAGSGLEQGLASLQAQYGLQQQGQQNQLLNMLLGYGLSPSFENIYSPEGPGFWESLAPALGQATGQFGPSLLQNYSNQPQSSGQDQQSSSIWANLLRYLPALIGAAGGAYLGGPAGATAGFQGGSSLGNLLAGSR